MSTEVNKAFVQQFSDNLIHLAQQRGSKLMSSVRQQRITGKHAHFDRLGTVTAQQKTSRHSDVEYSNTPHSRRRVSPDDFYVADLVDKEDEVRMLIDPKSPYAMNMAWGLGRKVDDLLIAAATGNATSIDSSDSSSNVALGSGQTIDEDFGTGSDSNLTLEKIIEAKRILDSNDVDEFDSRFLIHNASALANLLNDTTVTSSDYSAIKALVRGEIDTYLGFKFVRTERISGTADGTDTDPKLCLAYTKTAMGLAIGRDISVKMAELPEKHYATQVYASMTMGATRIEEEKMVSIECVQAA